MVNSGLRGANVCRDPPPVGFFYPKRPDAGRELGGKKPRAGACPGALQSAEATRKEMRDGGVPGRRAEAARRALVVALRIDLALLLLRLLLICLHPLRRLRHLIAVELTEKFFELSVVVSKRFNPLLGAQDQSFFSSGVRRDARELHTFGRRLAAHLAVHSRHSNTPQR